MFGRDLARHLGDGIPFYGLHAHGVRNLAEADTSVEAMARRYLPEIRRAQPVGPYYLGGYCMGGLVAYEMAQMLRKEGETVGLVAMIDTYNPAAIRIPNNVYARLKIGWEKTWFQFRNISRLPSEQRRIYMTRRFGATIQRRSARVRARLGGLLGRMRPGTNGTTPNLVEDINDAAGERYRPLPYDGDVVVFRPEITYSVLGEPSMGWTGFVRGSLRIINLPVAPGGMLVDPFIGTVAAELRDSLSKALARRESASVGSSVRATPEAGSSLSVVADRQPAWDRVVSPSPNERVSSPRANEPALVSHGSRRTRGLPAEPAASATSRDI
ncbi:MAG: hypothetical protein JNL97_12995 [Verrucomicrobiales bacterium]|nr:hypothetical protein [Verrucomicrobiales bacterium]